MSVCEKCPFSDPCIMHLPSRVYGGIPTLPQLCAIFTCGEGLAAALAARERGDGEPITVDSEEITAYIFGSPSKPTYDLEATIHRYVTPDGRIMATSPDGAGVIFTGLTTDILASVWGRKG